MAIYQTNERTNTNTRNKNHAQKRVEHVGDTRSVIPPQSLPEGASELDKQISRVLAGILADNYLLRLKVQEIHWNVEGPLFDSIHKMTEEYYTVLDGDIDELAERIRMKKFFAPANFKTYDSLSILSFDEEAQTAKEMIEHLTRYIDFVVSRFKDGIEAAEEAKDPGTADLLTAFLQHHEKYLWMFSSLLGGSSVKL